MIVGLGVVVDAAVEIARILGVPEVIIGLTVLAIGTSLPELVASVMATMRGHVGLAIGNVVGSNIFNLLLVLGVTSLIRPFSVPDGGYIDLAVVLLLSLLLVFVSATSRRVIIRSEALVLMLIYVSYVGWRAFDHMPVQ